MKLDMLMPSFAQLKHFSVVEATGSDAASFLHRLSTNHITNLEIGKSCLTSFLDQKGRLVAIAYVLRIDQARFLLITPYLLIKSLQEWLDAFLFAEDVVLREVSSQHTLTWHIGLAAPGLKGPDFHFRTGVVHSSLVLDAQSQPDARSLSEEEFEALRVAGGVPFSAHEINANFNPLQLGLAETIHWAKGCYIGQEVVSRLESKEKGSKTLLPCRVAATELHKLKLGEAVHGDEGAIGILTSAVPFNIAREANVIVVLKRAHAFSHGTTELSKVRIDSQVQDE